MMLKLVEESARDLRGGLRQLTRTPVVTVVAILALALGIGSNTAVFSILDAALLQKLPVPHPDELRTVMVVTRDSSTSMSNVPMEFFRELRKSPRSYSAVFGYYEDTMNVGIGAQLKRVEGQMVSGGYYSGLGVPMYLGRPIMDADEVSGDRAAVLSYRYWMSRFAGDPSVIGESIFVNGVSATIIGVTPPEFFGADRGASPDVTVPLDSRPDSALSNVWVTVRLRPEVTDQQALAEADLALERAKESMRPELAAYRAVDRDRILGERAGLRPGAKGLGYALSSYVEPLRVLILLSAVVLLIACVNIANLLLARSQARANEIGVRLALGAGRGRLVRQLLTESAILAVTGTVAGVALGFVLHRALILLLMDRSTTQAVAFTLDSHLLLFNTAATLLTLGVFGIVPALQATKVDVWSTLKRGSRAGGTGGLRLSKALIVVQVAASLLLLYGAGLLERTFRNLSSLDTGLEMENLLLLSVGMSPREFQVPVLPSSTYQQIARRVGELPGVLSVAFGADYGFSSGGWNKSVWVEGQPPERRQQTKDNVVGPGFFATAGLALLAGRDFTSSDRPDTPKVVIINEAFARHFFPGKNPVGRHVGDNGAGSTFSYEVIGVVADARTTRLRDDPEPFLYQALLQEETAGNAVLHVRTRGNPGLLQQRIATAIHAVDSRLPVYESTTLRDRFSRASRRERMMAVLSTFFGLLALLLTAIGLYGVVAYSVARRTSELGVRLALGAAPGHLRRMILRETLVLVSAGAVCGIPLALATGSALKSMLFGVKVQDAFTTVCCVAVLLAAGYVAGFFPARRAARLDPMAALRSE